MQRQVDRLVMRRQ